MYQHDCYLKIAVLILAGLLPQLALAYECCDWKSGKMAFQLGAAFNYAGESKHIGINGLIGDYFSVHSHTDTTIIAGLGYYLNGPALSWADTKFGLNAFYIPSTNVSGIVTQEGVYNNLSFEYNVTSLPILFDAKAEIHTDNAYFTPTIDIGIGPNVLSTSGFSEGSLDHGVTLPDNIFKSNTEITLGASLGAGVKFNKVNLGAKSTLECGYRFYYLGNGSLAKANGQVQNSLDTGNVYSNTLLCTLSV